MFHPPILAMVEEPIKCHLITKSLLSSHKCRAQTHTFIHTYTQIDIRLLYIYPCMNTHTFLSSYFFQAGRCLCVEDNNELCIDIWMHICSLSLPHTHTRTRTHNWVDTLCSKKIKRLWMQTVCVLVFATTKIQKRAGIWVCECDCGFVWDGPPEVYLTQNEGRNVFFTFLDCRILSKCHNRAWSC